MRCEPALCVLILISLVASGCSRAVVDTDNPSTLTASAYRDTFEASVEVLRDYGFVIDRRDYRFGRITTLPLGSPNLFEVWNPLNTTADQAVESTLASEQRIVNVSFSSSPGRSDKADHTIADAGYTLEVKVVIERKQIPTRRLAGSARRSVFSNLEAPPQELVNRGVPASYFQPVGRDPYLEARLVEQITKLALTGG